MGAAGRAGARQGGHSMHSRAASEGRLRGARRGTGSVLGISPTKRPALCRMLLSPTCLCADIRDLLAHGGIRPGPRPQLRPAHSRGGAEARVLPHAPAAEVGSPRQRQRGNDVGDTAQRRGQWAALDRGRLPTQAVRYSSSPAVPLLSALGLPVPAAEAICGVDGAALGVCADEEAPALGGDGRAARLACTWCNATPKGCQQQQQQQHPATCGVCQCRLLCPEQVSCRHRTAGSRSPAAASLRWLKFPGNHRQPPTWAAHALLVPPLHRVAAADAKGLVVVPGGARRQRLVPILVQVRGAAAGREWGEGVRIDARGRQLRGGCCWRGAGGRQINIQPAACCPRGAFGAPAQQAGARTSTAPPSHR